MSSKEVKKGTLHYDGTYITAEKVVEEILDFCIRVGSYSGESLTQNDEAQLEAVELLSNIVDDHLKMSVEWEDDDD